MDVNSLAELDSSAGNEPRLSSEESISEEQLEDSSQSDLEDVSESDDSNEESEFADFLSKLRDLARVKEILDTDGNITASRIVEDCEAMVAATHQTNIHRPTSICHAPLISSLREVSSHMSAFQTSPVTPDGSSCSSALNAARQIAYWSSLFISMMDSSNSANTTSAPSSSTYTSSSSPVLSSQSPLVSSWSLPSYVTTSAMHQTFPSSLRWQNPTSSAVIPQPAHSSTTCTFTASLVSSSQPPLTSSWSLPPYVTTSAMQQTLPSSSRGQNPSSSAVIPQPAPSLTTCTSTSSLVSSRQPPLTSSWSLPPYVTTTAMQQTLRPLSFFGQNATSSDQPASSGSQSSPQACSTSTMGPPSTSFLSSTSVISVPSPGTRLVSPHPPPILNPQSPAASCQETPSSGHTMHVPSRFSCVTFSSLCHSSELPPVFSTLSSPVSLPHFPTSSSCTVFPSFHRPHSSLPFIGQSSLAAQYPSALSVLQPPSSSSAIQLLPQSFTAPAINQAPPGSTCSLNMPLFGHTSSTNQPTVYAQSTLLSNTYATMPASHAPVPLSQAAPSSLVIDPNTYSVHEKYGLPGQSCLDWLNSLKIPRNVESLQQVKEIWELGSQGCPPLKDWTALMRNYKSSSGKNTSIYSQRKYIYNLFQKHGFDVNSVLLHYHEVKPGKLYKLLNTKQK